MSQAGESAAAPREVNEDRPSDWTEWFETGEPDDPFTEWTPEERAAAEKAAAGHRKRVEASRADDA